MSDEQVCNVALGLTSGVGSVLTRQLISYCGSATGVFRSTKSKLMKIPGIGPKTAGSLLNKENLLAAEAECRLAQQEGVTLLFYTDAAYPNRLRSVEDAPTLLYTKGNADWNAQKSVAIVGTRKATAYGKQTTEEIIAELSRYPSLFIISGLAYGIDIAAHKAALKFGVPTVGVMASGIDIIYPASHQSTAIQMLERGGLITEYSMGTKPDAPHFPARNRIIAALADVVIVVEAAVTGGALITAELANGYNRDVFAVPGNLGNKYSEGCNRLIRNHKASIFTGIHDLEYLMNWQENAPVSAKPTMVLPDLSAEEKQVVTLLASHKEMLMDELSWQAQLPIGQLASLLLNLELQGVVKALPGKKFTLRADTRTR